MNRPRVASTAGSDFKTTKKKICCAVASFCLRRALFGALATHRVAFLRLLPTSRVVRGKTEPLLCKRASGLGLEFLFSVPAPMQLSRDLLR